MKNALPYVLGGITVVGAAFGFYQWADSVVDGWAQGVEQRVQQSVGERIDQQQRTLDMLACTAVYGKSRQTCLCEFFETQQPHPRPELCSKPAYAERVTGAAVAAADSGAAVAAADSVP